MLSPNGGASETGVMGRGSESLPYCLALRGLPQAHFVVHSFRGREALSKPWAFDVIVTTSEPEDTVERISLGHPAVFVTRLAGVNRTFSGVLARITSLGPRDGGTHGARSTSIAFASFRACGS